MDDLSRKAFSEEMLSDDEFDELVSELLQIEPPASLVDRILQSVMHISLARSEQAQALSLKDQHDLIIYHNDLLPS